MVKSESFPFLWLQDTERIISSDLLQASIIISTKIASLVLTLSHERPVFYHCIVFILYFYHALYCPANPQISCWVIFVLAFLLSVCTCDHSSDFWPQTVIIFSRHCLTNIGEENWCIGLKWWLIMGKSTLQQRDGSMHLGPSLPGMAQCHFIGVCFGIEEKPCSINILKWSRARYMDIPYTPSVL